MSITISSFSSTLPDLLCTLWVISLARVFVGEPSPELRLLDVVLVLALGDGIGVGGVAEERLSFLSAAAAELTKSISTGFSVVAF
jgi:hypothetical protein